MNDSLIPVSDEQAKLATEALKTLQGFGGFLREVLGTVPEDLVGLCGGDWLKVRRAENLAAMLEKAKELLQNRGVHKPHPANLKVALPVFEAAANEGRSELREIWARLLAAAADPSRADRVRVEFLEVAKQLEPLDAEMLFKLRSGGTPRSSVREHLVEAMSKKWDEIDMALSNLQRLDLIVDVNVQPLRQLPQTLTFKGREFMRSLCD